MRKKHFAKKTLAAATCCGFAVLMDSAAMAADNKTGIQEVIVTAQKREENLQTTPIAISAMSSETLAARGITSFEGVAKASPSITFTPYPNSSNLLILYMRGQGVSDPAQITSDGSVGLYQDGFYISRPQASTFDLADIERVEVLRGPQGTLYGRNTTGGAVNLISKKPTGEFGFKEDLSFGTRDLYRTLTSIDLPKWNDLSVKLTVLKSGEDGYVKNLGSGQDYGEEYQKAGRIALHWDATSSLSADYFMEKGNLDSTPGYYQNSALDGTLVNGVPYHTDATSPVSHTYRPVDLKLSTSNFEGHGLTLNFDVNDHLTIKSLTGYRKLDWDAYQDFAEAFGFVVSANPAFPIVVPISFTSRNQIADHQFSQEVQFIGDLADSRIKYVGGLYYFNEGSGSVGTGNEAGVLHFRDVTSDAKSEAIYAQTTWTPPVLSDRLDLTLGIRETRDNRQATRVNILTVPGLGVLLEENGKLTGTDNDETFNKFNWSINANYAWTDDLNTYLKYSTGYKAGGSSESGPVDHFGETFQPENVRALEAGLKSYWWDRRVRANFAVYENKIDDMQLAFAANSSDASVVQDYNAGKATNKGFEADILVAPIDDLSFSLEYAYLDAKMDKITAKAGTIFDPAVNTSSPYVVGSDITKIFVAPYAPKNSVDFATDYKFYHFATGSLSAHLDYHFQSSLYDTASAGPDVPGRDNVKLASSGLINGRFTLDLDLPRGDHAKISLWGKNLAHHDYVVQAVGAGGSIPTTNLNIVPNVPVTVGAGYLQSAKIWAEPPSFGVDISYQY